MAGGTGICLPPHVSGKALLRLFSGVFREDPQLRQRAGAGALDLVQAALHGEEIGHQHRPHGQDVRRDVALYQRLLSDEHGHGRDHRHRHDDDHGLVDEAAEPSQDIDKDAWLHCPYSRFSNIWFTVPRSCGLRPPAGLC